MSAEENAPAGGSSFQKLIRCSMVNPEGETSIRYVTLEYFPLWEYMMQNRHGFTFEEYSLCMWISAKEFEQKSDLYSHSGELETVNRFNIDIYDDNYHYTYSVSRFVMEDESEEFQQIVLSHVPEEVRESDRFSMEIVPGYCIVKENAPERERFVMGLYGGLHDIY